MNGTVLTKGQSIIRAAEAAETALRQLTYGPHNRSDLARVIEPLGSQIELYLRSTAFPMSHRKDTFENLIDKLRQAGLSQFRTDQLHKFRVIYNKSKHDPTYELSIREASAIVRNAGESLAEIDGLGLGSTRAPVDRSIRYHLQVAAWDHFGHGDTEIVISVPGPQWTGASTLDSLFIRGTDWDALKTTLLADERFHLGKEHFRPEIWDFLANEGDFVDAGIWDGNYRDLVRMIAQFEWREANDALLWELRRDTSMVSIGTSLVMAAIDVVGAMDAQPSPKELMAQIVQRADDEYALRVSAPHVRQAGDQLAKLICTVPFAEWKGLIGPLLRPRLPGRSKTNEETSPLPRFLEDGALVLDFR